MRYKPSGNTDVSGFPMLKSEYPVDVGITGLSLAPRSVIHFRRERPKKHELLVCPVIICTGKVELEDHKFSF